MSVNAINPKICNPDYANNVPEAHEENWTARISDGKYARRLHIKGDFAIVTYASNDRASIYLNCSTNCGGDNIEIIISAKRKQKRWWKIYVYSKYLTPNQKHTLVCKVSWGSVLGFDDTANSNNSVFYTSAEVIFIEDFDTWFDM